MNRPPAFQFYAKDWLSSKKIVTMALEEEGAYIHLLAHCWDSPDCTLPDDDAELATLSRMGERWFTGGSTALRKCFVPHPRKQGRLTNLRLLEDHRKYARWRQKSHEGGLRSGQNRRKQAKGGSTVVEPTGNSSSSSSSSIRKEEEEGLYLHSKGFSVEEVLKLWNQIPGAKSIQFERLTPGRGIHKRIVTLTTVHKHDACEWWGSVFEAVRAQQHFLFSGSNPKQWIAQLDWVLGAENLAKVLERRYEDFKPLYLITKNSSNKPAVSRPTQVVL